MSTISVGDTVLILIGDGAAPPGALVEVVKVFDDGDIEYIYDYKNEVEILGHATYGTYMPYSHATASAVCDWEWEIGPQTHDAVNHPPHYTFGKYEVLDVIEDWELPYHLGAAVKYIARAGRKDPEKTIEDLKKAVFYVNRFIELQEKSS